MKRNLRRGDRVKIKGGQYDGALATVDSTVFQRTHDHPSEFRHGYHLVLDCGTVITVSKNQVE
jgi:hypothetical protein|tara:strand:+ start:186 stop:374 length:189 start_codon:yes stop_codon:yes gene_type:complete